MRLTYITRTAIPSRAAQSRQIISMATAFQGVLGEGFRLLCTHDGAAPAPWLQPLRGHSGSDRSRYLAACREAVRAARADREGVVYTRDAFVALAAVACGGRAVFEAHKEPLGLAARSCLRLLRASPRFSLVVISQALRRFYIERYAFAPARVLAAHDGVFAEEYDAALASGKPALRHELGLPPDGLLVVHTGSLFDGRGADLFEPLLRARGDLLFVQVGGEDADIARWRSHYAALGLGNIRFVPRADAGTVRRYQVAADILFYMITPDTPTYWCCSPLKLFEYMASGTPILGAHIGSIREVLDERNSQGFDPLAPATAAQGLARLLADPQSAQAKAELARRQARDLYSWRVRARRIADFIGGDPPPEDAA